MRKPRTLKGVWLRVGLTDLCTLHTVRDKANNRVALLKGVWLRVGLTDLCTLHTVRDKAKNLVALLKDESRLKEERQRGMQARERQGGIGSDGSVTGTPTGTPKSNKK